VVVVLVVAVVDSSAGIRWLTGFGTAFLPWPAGFRMRPEISKITWSSMD